MMRRECFFIFPIFCLLPNLLFPGEQKEDVAQFPSGNKTADCIKKAKVSVVSVQTFVSNNQKVWSRVGSGFIYDQDGFVVTQHNVVWGGDSIVVTLHDNRKFPANVVYYDEITKVALLKISAKDLLPLPIGKSDDLNVESLLTVLGNSLGVFPSITLGTYRGKNADGMLKMDAMIPPGNCGSPVLDEKGFAVGIFLGHVTKDIYKSREQAKTGIALPIEKVREVVENVLKHSEGWIGISAVDLEDTSSQKGVRVLRLTPNGPADNAGICKGDTIVAFDEHPILNVKELAKKIRDMPPDYQVKLTITKGNEQLTRRVRVGRIPWRKNAIPKAIE